jgi:hypothetical protein
MRQARDPAGPQADHEDVAAVIPAGPAAPAAVRDRVAGGREAESAYDSPTHQRPPLTGSDVEENERVRPLGDESRAVRRPLVPERSSDRARPPAVDLTDEQAREQVGIIGGNRVGDTAAIGRQLRAIRRGNKPARMRTIAFCDPDRRLICAGVAREGKTGALRRHSRGALLLVSAGCSDHDECDRKCDADTVGAISHWT